MSIAEQIEQLILQDMQPKPGKLMPKCNCAKCEKMSRVERKEDD